MKHLVRLPYISDYGIDITSNIINLSTGQIAPVKMIHGSKWVLIHDKYINISEIMKYIYFGQCPGEFKYLDHDQSHTELPNLKLVIKSNIEISPSERLINNEYFRQIPGYENYFISTRGVIYSEYYHKILKRSFNHNGYPTVALIDASGHRSPKKVHRLVYLTFCNPLDSNMIIDHNNSNKLDPFVDNLNQISQYDNVYKAYDSGNNTTKRWDLSVIDYICKSLAMGLPSSEIIKHLDNVSYRDLTMLIHNIRYGKLYKDISTKYTISYNSSINKKDRKLTPTQVLEIRSKYKDGTPKSKLAKLYNCSSSTITSIINYKTWKHVSDGGT